jgi:hypothetical protein
MNTHTGFPYRGKVVRSDGSSGAMASSDLTQSRPIDIAKQNRQLNTVSTVSFFSGVVLTVAAGLGMAAYAEPVNSDLFLSAALFMGLAGLILVVYAGAVIGRLYAYIYNGEIIIESQNMTIMAAKAEPTRDRFHRAGEATGLRADPVATSITRGPWRIQ